MTQECNPEYYPKYTEININCENNLSDPEKNSNSANNNNNTIVNYLAYRLNSFTMDSFDPQNNSGNGNTIQSQTSANNSLGSSSFGLSMSPAETPTKVGSQTQFLYEYPVMNQSKVPVRRRNYCKLFFKILIVLVSFAGFLYQATDICAHYFSYRTVVYTNTEQDALVDLPSITFCLPTYFTKKTLEELYAPYIQRNVDETGFKNRTMLDAIKPVIYETFQVNFLVIFLIFIFIFCFLCFLFPETSI